MKLLFLGDIGTASAPAAPPPRLPATDLVVANLEGAILDDAELKQYAPRNYVALHNTPSIVDYLKQTSVGAVALANNHVYDFDAPIALTRNRLAAAGIESFGAGSTLADAAMPATLERGGTQVMLFAFGWHVIGCHPQARARPANVPPESGGRRAQRVRGAAEDANRQEARPVRGAAEGVNPLEARHTLDTARRARAANPDAFIVFMMHWNYELELYPQPAHRQLAHALIEAGVDAIVGGHPHVAEGVEMVNGKPVAYSLGNWLFPPRVVRGFHVQYPAFAQRQLALEVEVEGRSVRDVRLHWYRFDPDRCHIGHIGTEAVGGDMGSKLTPYARMSHAEYVQWFREHRTRRRGLPVYADVGSPANHVYDGYLRARHSAGEVLVRLGLKAEQRRPAPARVS